MTKYGYMNGSTGLADMALYANSITNNMMGPVMLYVYAACVFFIIGANSRAMITAGFSGFIIALILSTVGLTGTNELLVMSAVGLVGLFWRWVSG